MGWVRSVSPLALLRSKLILSVCRITGYARSLHWVLDLPLTLSQYNWTIVLPAELSAAALLINFWITRVNNAVWITIFLVLCVLINLGGARTYAEAEFWFASIKIVSCRAAACENSSFRKLNSSDCFVLANHHRTYNSRHRNYLWGRS
jgi:hypothetical protein